MDSQEHLWADLPEKVRNCKNFQELLQKTKLTMLSLAQFYHLSRSCESMRIDTNKYFIILNQSILFNSYFVFLNSIRTFLTLKLCTYYTIVYSYRSI